MVDMKLPNLPDEWCWARLKQLVANPSDDIVDGPFGSDMKASEYVSNGIPIIKITKYRKKQVSKKEYEIPDC